MARRREVPRHRAVRKTLKVTGTHGQTIVVFVDPKTIVAGDGFRMGRLRARCADGVLLRHMYGTALSF